MGRDEGMKEGKGVYDTRVGGCNTQIPRATPTASIFFIRLCEEIYNVLWGTND